MRGEGTLVILPALIAVVTLLGGCAGPGKLKVEPIATTESPAEQVNLLENDIGTARKDRVNVLSPTWFARAETSLGEAKKGLARGEPLSGILQDVAYGRAGLKRAKEMTEVAKPAIPDAIRARELARETLTGAKRKLGEADAFISGQRYQKENVQANAAEAVFHARRLVQVTRQSEKIRTMQPEQPALWMEGILSRITGKLSVSDMRSEPIDLQVENILGSIDGLQKDQQFLAGKVRSHHAELEARKRELTDLLVSTQQQLATLDEAARRKIAALDEASRKQIAALEGETARGRAEKERLAAEREFQLKYNDVRAFFAPNEAEVYEEGNRLVIRLREIRFPVGKEVILPDNYGLLPKGP